MPEIAQNGRNSPKDLYWSIHLCWIEIFTSNFVYYIQEVTTKNQKSPETTGYQQKQTEIAEKNEYHLKPNIGI